MCRKMGHLLSIVTSYVCGLFRVDSSSVITLQNDTELLRIYLEAK